ncbi:5-formyltetrahydrofolate cyclo-ligase [Rhizobium sp. 9140]|uniref:5-formyltetrahydrofolate cyclo-ligase n=1 Tax=Rhizobium sp. 9140 TaxID=1761900 RepID=UPI00079BCBF8|nr:5-formyltetrahydrofolate cyclo-ligase [Rhizobium sp. 9140]CZT33080.1 5-formyltetrahydrofolate cyclo-ligase [Rhizobium sp. 9140]
MTLTSREQKALLRAERLSLRDALSPEARAAGAAAMLRHIGTPEFARAFHLAGSMVSGFWPIRSEPDIRPLLEALRGMGARLCLPVVLDRETIVFREYRAGSPVVKTGFGTTGPDKTAPEVDPDIMLVPLSAFDRGGHRIGYGAGHYDRAIARLDALGKRPRLIGIAFACQEVASVPFEPHDIPLDAILTEEGLIETQRRGLQARSI